MNHLSILHLDMSLNQEILVKVLVQFGILQIFLALAWYFAFILSKEYNRKFTFIFFSLNIMIYFFINLVMINDLITQPDLSQGGVTFAFEMLTAIYSISHLVIVFIVIGLLRGIRFFIRRE